MDHPAAHRQPASRTGAAATPPRPQASRVEEAFRSARRHSGRVRALKLALPLAAVVLAAAFVVKSWLAVPPGVSVNLAGTAIEDGRLVMSDPRLDGFTGDNRAYTMTAARAIQEVGDNSRIDLEGISAKLPFDQKNWLTVVARNGVFNREANTLGLDTDILLSTDTGVKALLKTALVDIRAGSLTTTDPVDITLEGARIEADSMTVSDSGAVMIFERRVRMEIAGGRGQFASNGGGGTNEN